MAIDYDSEARLHAIALNAVREATIVYRRADLPFTDDDAARIENIFQILHLYEARSDYEHGSLVSEHQNAVAATSRKISDLLANLSSFDESADPIVETPAPTLASTKPPIKQIAAAK